MAPPSPSDQRAQILADGWGIARLIVAWLLALTPSPAALAAQPILLKAVRGAILAWLAPGEALVRRLLLVEAVARAALLKRAPARLPRAIARLARRPRLSPPDESARWVVALRWPAGKPRALSARQRRRARPRDLPAPGALAERIEALVRIVAAPERAVARLARRLARGTPKTDGFVRLNREARVRPGDPAAAAIQRLAPFVGAALRAISSA